MNDETIAYFSMEIALEALTLGIKHSFDLWFQAVHLSNAPQMHRKFDNNIDKVVKYKRILIHDLDLVRYE